MSEQILRNPKNHSKDFGYQGSLLKTFENKSVQLTKIKNPLSTKCIVKADSKVQHSSNEVTARNKSNNITKSSYQRQNIENRQAQNRPQRYYAQKKFYEDANTSSDDSYLNQSRRQQGRLGLQEKINQQFKNSRRQIEQLLQKGTKKQFNQKKTQEISMKMPKKNRKLQYFHCDSIVIKPEVPSSNKVQNGHQKYLDTKYQNEIQNNEKSLDESYLSAENRFYESQSEQNSGIFKNSFESKHSNQNPNESTKKTFYKQLTQKPKSKDYLQVKSKHNPQNSKCAKNNFTSYHIQNYQQTEQTQNFKKQDDLKQTIQNQEKQASRTFKKRNKIFTTDKRYGLKLSRAIKHEEQIKKLEGQLGVDVFHIIIEEQQLLRQCCS